MRKDVTKLLTNGLTMDEAIRQVSNERDITFHEGLSQYMHETALAETPCRIMKDYGCAVKVFDVVFFSEYRYNAIS